MSQLGLNRTYEEMVAKYGKENADFIHSVVGNWTSNYTNMCYVEMGVCDERPHLEQARADAAGHGWTFDQQKGDWTLLEKLFYRKWDDDFIILQPGQKLAARNDESALAVE